MTCYLFPVFIPSGWHASISQKQTETFNKINVGFNMFERENLQRFENDLVFSQENVLDKKSLSHTPQKKSKNRRATHWEFLRLLL